MILTDKEIELALSSIEFSDNDIVFARAIESAIIAKQAKAEPVCFQFQDTSGKWCDFIDKRHYDNTVKDGRWPIRSLYEHPPVSKPGWKFVPIEPDEDQWGGLARDMMMWLDFDRPTPKKLFDHLEMLNVEIPDWLRNEPEMLNLDHVPSKGTRCVILYKAMLEAAPGAEK